MLDIYSVERVPLKPFGEINVFSVYFVNHSHQNLGGLIHILFIVSKICHRKDLSGWSSELVVKSGFDGSKHIIEELAMVPRNTYTVESRLLDVSR